MLPSKQFRRFIISSVYLEGSISDVSQGGFLCVWRGEDSGWGGDLHDGWIRESCRTVVSGATYITGEFGNRVGQWLVERPT